MYLIFDTETTGLPISFSKPISDLKNWDTARCVQIAWQLHDEFGSLIDSANDIIKPNGFEIPLESTDIHGISNNIALTHGISIVEALGKLTTVLSKTAFLIGHNVNFDINILGSEYLRLNQENPLVDLKTIDTMTTTINYCQLSFGQQGVVKTVSSNGSWTARDGVLMYKFKIEVYNNLTGKIESGLIHKKTNQPPALQSGDQVSYTINNKGTIKTRKGFKPPKLEELYSKLFSDSYLEKNAHNGAADVNATARCFFEILRQRILSSNNTELTKNDIETFLTKNDRLIELADIDLGPTSVNNNQTASLNIKSDVANDKESDINIHSSNFTHIRCHTSYSILQSTISVSKLVN